MFFLVNSLLEFREIFLNFVFCFILFGDILVFLVLWFDWYVVIINIVIDNDKIEKIFVVFIKFFFYIFLIKLYYCLFLKLNFILIYS